jgi:hypothetical protein
VDELIELTKAAIPPAVTIAAGATLKWGVNAMGARRLRALPPAVSNVILPPGVRVAPRASAPPRPVGVLPLMGLLAPVPRRTSPWKAAVAGGLGFGIGLGCYFRTKTDTVAAVALMIPMIAALELAPAYETPAWEYALIYGTMAAMAVYSALRAVSSNRRREHTPRRSYAERRQILRDELDALAAERWRVASVGEYEAVIACIARPNHVLHGVITLLTFGFWTPVWIVLTAAKRRRPQWAHHRLFVDHRGQISRERVPPPAGSGDAVVDVAPRRAAALDRV